MSDRVESLDEAISSVKNRDLSAEAQRDVLEEVADEVDAGNSAWHFMMAATYVVESSE